MSFKYRDCIAKVWNVWKVEIIHGLDPVVCLYDFIYIYIFSVKITENCNSIWASFVQVLTGVKIVCL